MGEFIKKVIGQINDFVKALTPAKRAGLAATAIIVFFGVTAVFMWAGNTTYVPLMTNLNPEDSSNIMRFLREKKIPFKMDTTGKVISIPPESVHDLRLELATIGLPQTSVVGYELFDKQQLGVTSYVQKVNEKRAKEGELIRTINTIKGVKRSRIHLAIPQKSAFVEDQKKPTASVVLDLEPGTTLNEKQIYGVGTLVARAVEGMDVADVVIVDAFGKTLSKNPADALSAMTANQLDFRTKIESDMEKRIEQMLGRVVGEGRIVARVSADIDFSQVNETQSIYDSDGSAVRTVQKDTRIMEGNRPAPGGAAGAASNTPGQQAPGQPALVKNNTNFNNELVNYEVPQTVRRTVKPAWSVKRLSVAVVVDGKTVKVTGKDGTVESKSEAWSAEKVKEFESIIANTVGLDRKRGDSLEIKNMEFTHEDFDEAQRQLESAERKSYLQNMITYFVIGLAIVLFFMMVVRPFIKWVTENTVDSVDSFLPQTIEELEKIQKNTALPQIEEAVPILPEKVDPEKVEGEMIKEKIITLVDANPHKAALILKDWLHAAAEKASKDKEQAGAPGGKGKSA